MAIPEDGVMGANIHSAGYGADNSWLQILALIAAGFLPVVVMISRSALPSRAEPASRRQNRDPLLS